MPLPQQSCPIPEDVCCNGIFDIAQYVLNRVYDGLVGCLPKGCDGQPMQLLPYVTMGQGDDGVADSLTVAFLGAIPSPNSLDQNGRLKGPSLFRGDFDVRLRESGWPLIRTDGGQLNAPDPALQQAIARHAYAHGEQMFRVLRSLAARVATPGGWLANYPNPAFATASQLRTINPQGGIVGFSSVLTVDLPWGIQGY